MALKSISFSAAAALALVAAPAFAGGPPTATAQPSLGGCATTYGTVVSGATACSGFYAGNVFSNNAGDVLTQQAAVSALGGSFDGDFTNLFGFGSLSNGSTGARTIDFGANFYGPTIIGAHFGNIAGPEGNVSVFWTFNFGTAGASSLTFLDGQGLSNLYVYGDPSTPAVPEPAAWALMILGFGAVGSVLRRSKKTKLALTYA
ncbi:PEPxxWA-CTERM sorting domain-containing protein [Porphyrobacter algicida]|uniref:PEPxxWA-CTERM sorting domain-containing protein n=1 Tax=Qipengyuania algicida TaxID=1836209 RepID=A0A845AHB3_9SPHN|nr:PEPxxWA-CTERM sorting domain-containing protein [Qipengyuania algicida]MXP28847.1 PEPxxWA-CTERM sorting domain-containing protein [Qipengyuania algicida]